MKQENTQTTDTSAFDPVELGSVIEETKGRMLPSMEFGVSLTSRDEIG